MRTQVGQQVEDQHHAAITQNGRPRHALYPGKLRAKAFDHDFTRARQRIHVQGHPLVIAMHQQHRQRMVLPDQLGFAHGLQQLAQVTQVVILARVVVHGRVELVIVFKLVGHHTHQPFNGVERNGVLLVAALHHQGAVE